MKRRDAKLRRSAIEQERPNAAIRHDDTVEFHASAGIHFWKSIIGRRLIWHETQAHLTIDSGRNCHGVSQELSTGV